MDVQLCLEPLCLGRQALDLLARHRAHLLVGVVGHVRARSSCVCTPRHARSAATIGSRRASSRPGRRARRVRRHLGRRQLAADLLVARLELGEPVDHAVRRGGRLAIGGEARLERAMLTSSIERSGGRVVSDWSHSPGA